jgi:hypothetical protein
MCNINQINSGAWLMRALWVLTLLLSTGASAEIVNPTVAYELPPGFSDAVVPNVFPAQISIKGIGAEDGGTTRIQNCTFSGQNAAAFTVSPGQVELSAAVPLASLLVRCTSASFSSVTMQCEETANPGNGDVPTNRLWTFSCSNLVIDRIAEPVYAPNLGSVVRLNGPANIGATANSTIELRVRQGFIIGPISVLGCQISGANAAAFGPAPGAVSLQPGSVLTMPLSCTRAASAQTAVLACTQTVGTNSRAVNWPLLCPGFDDTLFRNGFE